MIKIYILIYIIEMKIEYGKILFDYYRPLNIEKQWGILFFKENGITKAEMRINRGIMWFDNIKKEMSDNFLEFRLL